MGAHADTTSGSGRRQAAPPTPKLRHLLGRAIAAVAIAAATLITTTGPAAAAGTASITGNVTGTGNTPVEGLCVWSPLGGGTTTDINGHFELTGLDTGTYTVQINDCRPNPEYVTEWYDSATGESDATPIAAVDGTATDIGTINPDAGVTIAGTVRDSGTGTPISDIDVYVNDSSGGPASGWARTAADGTYRSTPVPNGTYRIQYSDGMHNTYATQYHNNTYRWDGATLLTVDANTNPHVENVDADMSEGADLSGNVTDRISGIGLDEICVTAVAAGGWSWLASTTTDINGNWTLHNVAPTTLTLQYRDCSVTPVHVEQWWNNKNSYETADTITATPGASSVHDAELDQGAVITGTVRDSGTGTPLGGISVNFSNDTTGTYGWTSTAADGTYRSPPLQPGDTRTQFRDNTGIYATQYYNNTYSWNGAELLTLHTGDTRSGTDANMNTAGSITGTVRDSSGNPAAGVCVNALDPQSSDWFGGTETDVNGNYTIGDLNPTATHVAFYDCHVNGPWAPQYYENAANVDDATAVNVAAGSATGGIDATLADAALITGTVREEGTGTPLSGVCVQASTTTRYGTSTTTDNNGNYQLVITDDGNYRIQYVACNDAAHVGRWHGGNGNPDSAVPVPVAIGDTLAGIDTELVTSNGPSTVTGNISNIRGDGLAACVVLFLPNNGSLFAQTDPAGNYTFSNVASGSWFLARAGCGPAGPTQTIADAGTSGANYAATWYDNTTVTWGDAIPDPFAQGADLLVVADDATTDTGTFCYGCGDVTIDNATATSGTETTITATLHNTTIGTPTGGVGAAGMGAAAVVDYTATCAAANGGPNVTGTSNTGTINLTGFTNGLYNCTVNVHSNGQLVASSATWQFTGSVPVNPDNTGGGTVTPDTGTGTGNSGGTANSGESTNNDTLARTGTNPGGGIAAGLALLITGIALALAGRHHNNSFARRNTRPAR